MNARSSEICIIGAGMAGLSCATALARAGSDVCVIDKGRGPGGRMAARRVEIAGETVSFDHGAQYFTARDSAFRAVIDEWEALGVVARWDAASASDKDPAFVGVPGMNAPIRAMAEPLGVEWSVRAERLVREDARWLIETDGGVYAAQLVVVAVPAEQAATLLAEPAPDLAAIPAGVASEPCWAAMAAFAEPLGIGVDTVRASDAAILWAARNSAKPRRAGAESWVIHASPARSRELLECDQAEAARALLADFALQTGLDLPPPLHLAAHRWLYALPSALPGEPGRFDAATGIGLAGDYLHSPRIEGAWLSGQDTACRILAAM